MARVFYRVGQFWQGFRAKVTPEEYGEAASVLPPAALPLFTQMPVDAQRHSLNVLHSVRAAGHSHPDLAVAALLHDCGKVAAAKYGVSLGLWLRGPLVLLDRWFPRQAARWALSNAASHSGLDFGATTNSNPTGLNPITTAVQGWRYALYVQREHAAIGAVWAKQAACSPLSCWLIAHHQSQLSALEDESVLDGEPSRLLAILQQADDGN